MIDLNGVSKSYSKGQPALDNVSLHVDEGEFVFIVGNSGSGKSTLIKLLLKELDPTAGTITVNGYALNKLRRGKVAKYRRGIELYSRISVCSKTEMSMKTWHLHRG